MGTQNSILNLGVLAKSFEDFAGHYKKKGGALLRCPATTYPRSPMGSKVFPCTVLMRMAAEAYQAIRAHTIPS